MNQIKDIFNTQFFVILGVVLLLVTCLVLYVEQKFKAYDHKMSSMLSLVSSLAEEMDIFKNNSNHSGGQYVTQNEIQTEINNLNTDLEESKLIDVSDEEDNTESDYESDDDNNLDSDSETGSDSGSDSGSDMESVDDVNEPKIVNTLDLGSNENEIITITKLEDLQSNDIVDLVEDVNDTEEKYDLDELDELEDLDNSLDSSNDLDDLDDIEEIGETNVVEELDDDEIEETNVVEELDDMEEINDDAIDYNKLSVAKLKEIALEKNLISNTSNKMKKADLLKLLEGN
jgi:hypothetical protein